MQKFWTALLDAEGKLFAWLPGAAWKLVQILLTVLIAYVVYRVAKRSILGFISRIDRNKALPTSARKLNTMRNFSLVFTRILIAFFAIAAIFNILNLTGVLTSLLATAGIGGLLIAFGAQSLVKDFIAGMLLTLEDQIAVGDFIQVNGLSGTVEQIGLRTIQMRGFNGAVHTLPAGVITTVTNYSRGDTLAVVDVTVPYGASIPRASAAIGDVIAAWAKKRPDIVKESPQLLAVTGISETGVGFRVVCKVASHTHWEAERELRELIKNRLARDGITIAYPHLVEEDADKESV